MGAKYTNAEMELMLEQASKHLDRTDIIGYAAARNVRALQGELEAYVAIRDKLIMKHGEPDVDADGNMVGTTSILPGSEAFAKFVDEIGPIMNAEGEPKLTRLPFTEAIGKISGTELEWMFED